MDGDTAGAAVALDTLGSTVTTASGAFAVTVNLSGIAPQFHQGDGSINLETQVFSRATVTTYNTVIAATQVAAANADTETFDLGKQTVLDSNSIVVDAHQQPVTQSLVEGTGTGAATSGAARPSCSNYDLGDLTQHQEIYGQSNGDPYVWGWLSEVYGTEQTLGIAAEESGSAWKVSGSANVEISWDKTHTHTSTTPKHAASYQWLNEINFHYWRQNCITITGQQVLTYSWRPSSTYDINTSSRTQSHPYYSYCDDKPSGLTESAGDGVRTSYSLGMEIEGVHLTVSSTYETEVDDEFQWTGPGQFCGDNENGPLNSANVEGVGW